MIIADQQERIIHIIRNEVRKEETPSSYRSAVWFQPSSGRFLFDDGYMRYEVIEPMISKEILVYRGNHIHQGEFMLKYELAKGI